MSNIISSFFMNRRIRPVTPLDVPPAPVPSQDKEDLAVAGRVRLDHNVAAAERTIAELHRQFAQAAVDQVRS